MYIWASNLPLNIHSSGFDYAFDSLNVHGEPNELNQAFDTIFRPGMAGASLFRLLKLFFPSLGRLVSGSSVNGDASN